MDLGIFLLTFADFSIILSPYAYRAGVKLGKGKDSMDQDDIVSRVTSQGVQFIIDCIKGGYEDYNNPDYYSDEAKRDHTSGVAAACRNCHIVARAKRMSIEMQSFIQIQQKRGRTTFILGDHTEIWYKKIGNDGKPSFRPSQQAFDYIKPPLEQVPLAIDLPPEKARWVAGYRSSSVADTEYEVVVSGPEQTGEWWEVRLLGAEIQELFPKPAKAPAPAATAEVIKKRVRVRKPKVQGE
jgi:hypothetical protein